MKSKFIPAILSFFFGSSGAQRFYLGQYNRGWTYLLVFWFFIPACIWAIKFFNVVYNWYPFLQGWVALIILVHLVESIYFLSLSNEKFEQQVSAKGNTILLTVLSLIILFVFAFGLKNLLTEENEINIDHAKVDFSMSSLEYSKQFMENEKEFLKLYANKVIELSGTVVSTGYDLETGRNYLLLSADAASSTDVHCYFNEAHQNQLNKIIKSQKVIIKGVCDGRFLENCTIIEK